LIYEGALDTLARDRFWDLVRRQGVTILYTFLDCDPRLHEGTPRPQKHDLSSLSCWGRWGSPTHPEAWIGYQKNIGGGRCPVHAHGQGGFPLPWCARRSSTWPVGREVKVGGGYFAIARLWPAMLRTIWGDDERYVATATAAVVDEDPRAATSTTSSTLPKSQK
jgi:acetyl-CoA synthetase